MLRGVGRVLWGVAHCCGECATQGVAAVVLQSVAVCYGVWRGVAGCCRVLQGVAGCCSVLQGVVEVDRRKASQQFCCSLLQVVP